MASNRKSAEIVKKYCAEYPNLPDLTLGKLIYKENSISFSSLAATHNSVRYHRGHCGEKNRRFSTKEFLFTKLYLSSGSSIIIDMSINEWEAYYAKFIEAYDVVIVNKNPPPITID